MAGRGSTGGKSTGATETVSTVDKSDSTPNSEKQLYDVLWNIRRRYVLYYTKHVGPTVQFKELVEQIAIWECFGSKDSSNRRKRKSIHNSLIQTHIPKLEQIGLIDYDRESNKITVTDRAEQIELYPASEGHDWEYGYSFLSVSFLSLVGLAFLGVISLSNPTSITLLLVLTLLLIALTVGHTYDRLLQQRRHRTKGPDIIIKDISTDR